MTTILKILGFCDPLSLKPYKKHNKVAHWANEPAIASSTKQWNTYNKEKKLCCEKVDQFLYRSNGNNRIWYKYYHEKCKEHKHKVYWGNYSGYSLQAGVMHRKDPPIGF